MMTDQNNTLIWPERSKAITDRFIHFYKNSALVDIAVRAGHTVMHAHRCVLAAASPILENRLQSDISVAEIHLNEFVEECTGQEGVLILELIYCGEVIVPTDRLLVFHSLIKQLSLVNFKESQLNPAASVKCNIQQSSINNVRTSFLALPDHTGVPTPSEFQTFLPKLSIPMTTFSLPDPTHGIPSQMLDQQIIAQDGVSIPNDCIQDISTGVVHMTSKFQKNDQECVKYYNPLRHNAVKNFGNQLHGASFSDLCVSNTEPEINFLMHSENRSLQTNTRLPENIPTFQQDQIMQTDNGSAISQSTYITETQDASLLSSNAPMDWQSAFGLPTGPFGISEPLPLNSQVNDLQHCSADLSSNCLNSNACIIASHPMDAQNDTFVPDHQQRHLVFNWQNNDLQTANNCEVSMSEELGSSQSISGLWSDSHGKTDMESNVLINSHKWCMPVEMRPPEGQVCSGASWGGPARLKVKSSIGGVPLTDLSRAGGLNKSMSCKEDLTAPSSNIPQINEVSPSGGVTDNRIRKQNTDSQMKPGSSACKIIVRTDIENVPSSSSAGSSTSVSVTGPGKQMPKTASISVVPSEELLDCRQHRTTSTTSSLKVSVVPEQQLLQSTHDINIDQPHFLGPSSNENRFFVMCEPSMAGFINEQSESSCDVLETNHDSGQYLDEEEEELSEDSDTEVQVMDTVPDVTMELQESFNGLRYTPFVREDSGPSIADQRLCNLKSQFVHSGFPWLTSNVKVSTLETKDKKCPASSVRPNSKCSANLRDTEFLVNNRSSSVSSVDVQFIDQNTECTIIECDSFNHVKSSVSNDISLVSSPFVSLPPQSKQSQMVVLHGGSQNVMSSLFMCNDNETSHLSPTSVSVSINNVADSSSLLSGITSPTIKDTLVNSSSRPADLISPSSFNRSMQVSRPGANFNHSSLNSASSTLSTVSDSDAQTLFTNVTTGTSNSQSPANNVTTAAQQCISDDISLTQNGTSKEYAYSEIRVVSSSQLLSSVASTFNSETNSKSASDKYSALKLCNSSDGTITTSCNSANCSLAPSTSAEEKQMYLKQSPEKNSSAMVVKVSKPTVHVTDKLIATTSVITSSSSLPQKEITVSASNISPEHFSRSKSTTCQLDVTNSMPLPDNQVSGILSNLQFNSNIACSGTSTESISTSLFSATDISSSGVCNSSSSFGTQQNVTPTTVPSLESTSNVNIESSSNADTIISSSHEMKTFSLTTVKPVTQLMSPVDSSSYSIILPPPSANATLISNCSLAVNLSNISTLPVCLNLVASDQTTVASSAPECHSLSDSFPIPSSTALVSSKCPISEGMSFDALNVHSELNIPSPLLGSAIISSVPSQPLALTVAHSQSPFQASSLVSSLVTFPSQSLTISGSIPLVSHHPTIQETFTSNNLSMSLSSSYAHVSASSESAVGASEEHGTSCPAPSSLSTNTSSAGLLSSPTQIILTDNITQNDKSELSLSIPITLSNACSQRADVPSIEAIHLVVSEECANSGTSLSQISDQNAVLPLCSQTKCFSPSLSVDSTSVFRTLDDVQQSHLEHQAMSNEDLQEEKKNQIYCKITSEKYKSHLHKHGVTSDHSDSLQDSDIKLKSQKNDKRRRSSVSVKSHQSKVRGIDPKRQKLKENSDQIATLEQVTSSIENVLILKKRKNSVIETNRQAVILRETNPILSNMCRMNCAQSNELESSVSEKRIASLPAGATSDTDNGDKSVALTESSTVLCSMLISSSVRRKKVKSSNIQLEKNVKVNCLKTSEKISVTKSNSSSVPISQEDVFSLKCIHCDTVCTNLDDLISHGLSHCSTKGDFICSFCNKKMRYRSSLKTHLRNHAIAERANLAPYPCGQCSAAYTQRCNLVRHLASRHSLSQDGITPLTRMLQCGSCQFQCLAKHKMLAHEQTHDESKLRKCGRCSYVSTSNSSLMKHARIHSKEKPFKCDQCDFRTVTGSSLHRHKRHHTQEKPHSCSLCGKCYADSKRLRDHLLMHDNLKPFKCALCPLEFRRKDNMQKHIRSVHPNVDSEMLVTSSEVCKES